MPNNTSYDLKSVKLPRLAGAGLAIVVNLAENPITKPFLIGNLLKSGGITEFRTLHPDEPPTFQPNPPRASAEIDHNRNTLETIEYLTSLDVHLQEGFHFASLRDYTEAYLEGHTTPEEVAEALLEAIADSESREPAMNIFIAWRREEILRQAGEATKRIQEGKPISPLDGVPVAIKDEVDMLPFPTTVGTSFLGHSPALEDSTVAARMRAAGAMLIGKTNMHEIGIGVTGQNPYHGTVRNPNHPGHYTGGSSSGPAAAVAAGFCPIAVGADGGGSIRIPSSFCGVIGLKPTFSRVSEYGAAQLCWSVAHLGPIAATAQDAAIGYTILSGPDSRDPNTLYQPRLTIANFERMDLSDLTLGVYWPWFRHATADVVSACEKMLAKFQVMGARVQEIEIPNLEAARVAHVITIASEIATALNKYHKEHQKDYSLEVRLNLALARSLTNRDYIDAQRIRTRLIEYIELAFKGTDVIITPTSAVTAPPIKPDVLPDGESDLSLLTEIMRYATPANLSGHPAISFPVGYDDEGMPIGMQGIGRYWEEHTLLRLAYVAEQSIEHKAPQIHYKLLNAEM